MNENQRHVYTFFYLSLYKCASSDIYLHKPGISLGSLTANGNTYFPSAMGSGMDNFKF